MHLEYQTAKADPVTGAAPLTRQSSAALLTQIVNECADQCVIFDLDSTLLDNGPRNAKIMQEFGVEQHEPELLTAKAKHFQDWSAENAMSRIGLKADKIQPLVRQYEPFWKTRFFTSEYCQHDIAIAGAAKFVSDIRQAGGKVRYLTGRDEGMRIGSTESLDKLGFPKPDSSGVELLMKPLLSDSDDTFKQNAIAHIKTNGRIKAAFDNEPSHINTYRVALQDAICVHLFTDHSMRPVRLSANIFSIENFER